MAKNKHTRGDSGGAAHRVWLAGLGALALAEEQGGRLFEALVGRGKRFEDQHGTPVGQAAGRVRGTVESVRHRADRTWKRVETAFDEQVSAALRRLGVPTQVEISRLTRCLEELNGKLEGRGGGPPSRRPATTTRRRSTNTKKRVARRKVVG